MIEQNCFHENMGCLSWQWKMLRLLLSCCCVLDFLSGGCGWKHPTGKRRSHLELEGDIKHFMASSPSQDWSLKSIGEILRFSTRALLLLQMHGFTFKWLKSVVRVFISYNSHAFSVHDHGTGSFLAFVFVVLWSFSETLNGIYLVVVSCHYLDYNRVGVFKE